MKENFSGTDTVSYEMVYSRLNMLFSCCSDGKDVVSCTYPGRSSVFKILPTEE
jgi:hypothetical protein